MRKIALTGTIGSGKTTVLRCFARLGAAVMSCDEVVRAELARNRALQTSLRRAFGDGIFLGKKLSRRRLARLVFEDQRKVAQLNRLVHPFVKKRVRAFFRKNKISRCVVVEVPLLFETDFYKLFDVTIGIAISARVHRQRLLKEGAWREGSRRMRWQFSQREKLARCDFIIDNSSTKKEALLRTKNLMEEEQWLKN